MTSYPMLTIRRSSPQTQQCQEGATLVEFTFIALIIVAFLLASIELLRMAFITVTLQFAVSAALRNAVVSEDDAAAIAQDVQSLARGLTLDLPAVLQNSDPPGLPAIRIDNRPLRVADLNWRAGAGEEDCILRIRALREIKLLGFGGDWSYTVSALAVGVRDQ